ncbi:gamma-glutamyl-gamma-aminobutyrate hydrolase family protein, partial [bacterium]|nr:gamma-glutamyl-gamma-aminobutyrate hydrolase family protein [bacterium]
DGVIEAIEGPADGPFALGVEWHPELMEDAPEQQRLFDALVRAASPAGR